MPLRSTTRNLQLNRPRQMEQGEDQTIHCPWIKRGEAPPQMDLGDGHAAPLPWMDLGECLTMHPWMEQGEGQAVPPPWMDLGKHLSASSDGVTRGLSCASSESKGRV